MPTVARFSDPLRARRAAAFLRAHGVLAGVVEPKDAFGGWGPSEGLCTVAVLHESQTEPARALLSRLEAEPMRPDPGWEEASRPDLSRLDPDTPCPCPACGHHLPLDADLPRCPACHAAADPVEVLVALHGPELLDTCFAPLPDAADQIDEVDLIEAPMPCPACGYNLASLPLEDVCPECGRPYSKRDMLRGIGLL